MEMAKYKVAKYSANQNRADEAHNFGFRDDKGRLIGANVETWECDVTHEEHEDRADWVRNYSQPRKEGHYFVFCPHALRNGERYGAVQRDQFFTDAEERDAAVRKYLENAKKRAAKRAA